MNFWLFSRTVAVVCCAVALCANGACSSKGSGDDADKTAQKGRKGKKGKKDKGKKGGKGKGKGKGKGAPSPPPAAPPAVVAAAALPVPDLPELAAHAKPDAAKAGGAESKCGDSAMGEVTVALDCAGAEEALPHPLTPVVPYALVHAEDAALPAVVDHRATGTEGAVRTQGKAPMSSAFALASAIDHAIGVWTATPGKTSVMHVWSRYHAGSLSKAIKGSAEAGLADEETWPFVGADATSWFETCEKWAGAVKCGKPVDPEKLKAADAKPTTLALETEDLGAAVEVPLLRAKLAAGEDVLVALKVGPSFKPAGKEGAMYVPNYLGEKGTHTVLLAGYATSQHGTYFLVHNSAGEKWGDKGYAWLHEATLKPNLSHAYVVNARPVDATKIKHPMGKPTAPCQAGQFPDSATGACAGICPDHSPRNNNVCPKKEQCPSGLVNLWGECVLAAPSKRSDEKAKDVRFVCGPGGCFYRVAKGQAGCTQEWCPTSCYSPSFRAMGGGKEGLTCWQ